MKVAIVGLSPSHDEAPFGNPEWELWGLPWDKRAFGEFDRYFEMHDLPHFKDNAEYIEHLNDCQVLYTQEQYSEIKTSIAYQLKEVAETIGGAYWTSSVGYMMALAIHEGATEISLFGVDMASEYEYGYQRPNMEYLIGFAKAKGIKVHILESSSLCKFTCDEYKTRYGWSE
jgi:hypothetical protein